jgi:sarcosine oxidase gamma subunit
VSSPPTIASIPPAYGAAPVEYAALRRGSAVDRVAPRALLHVDATAVPRLLAVVALPGAATAARLALVHDAAALLSGCATIIHRAGGDALVDASNATVEPLLTAAGVPCHGLGTAVVRLRLRGPRAAATLAIAGALAPTAVGGVIEGAIVGGSPAILALVGADRYALYCDREHARTVWDALIAAGAVPVGSLALETVRIEDGEPCLERDFPQPVPPAEAGFASRGSTGRRLVALEHEGVPPLPSAIVRTLDGIEIGRVRVAVPSVARAGRPVALAAIAVDHATPGLPVLLDGGATRVRGLVSGLAGLAPGAAAPSY